MRNLHGSLRLVSCGIPQGSCLGPLLFILYTNDFEESLIDFAPNMYADGTSITLGGEDAYQLLEDLRNELQDVIDLLRQNKLSLSVAKCEFMFSGNSKQLGKISEIGDLKVGEDEIKRVRKTNYFGTTIDETLSWNQHYKIGKGKLKGGLDSIRKLRQLLPKSQLFQVYRALVESHLRYGNLLWGHLSATKLSNLQKLQERAITLIHSAPSKDRIPSATLDVNELIKLDQAMMVHEILHEQCPEILKQKFTKRSHVSKYETRRANDLQIPRPRLEITKKSFLYKGAKVWNDIPNNIRNVESAALFKEQVRNYFLVQ